MKPPTMPLLVIACCHDLFRDWNLFCGARDVDGRNKSYAAWAFACASSPAPAEPGIDIVLNWKIDTLDARGGLGFASWRAGDLSKSSNIRLDTPCLFFGAPHFQPEPVANRA